MQRTANENAACIHMICKRSDQPKIERFGKDFGFEFHLRSSPSAYSGFVNISRPAAYFTACYTVLKRPNEVETAVHGCNLVFSLNSIASLPRAFYVVSALHHCLLVLSISPAYPIPLPSFPHPYSETLDFQLRTMKKTAG